jgi:putative glutamine amidotransferase
MLSDAKPIIAITIGRLNLDSSQLESQRVWSGCNSDYILSVARSGGAPVLLSCFAGRDAIRSILSAANGVLLTGGGDVSSLIYREEPHPNSAFQDPLRDHMEIEVIRTALEMHLPILGICRGPQILNVALGGTLIQDIPSQVDGGLQHSSRTLVPMPLHTIDIQPDSLLAGVLGATSITVNSGHHQAVGNVAKGLRSNCQAKDGVIEGVESAEGLPLLAVQCHPEEIAVDYPVFQSLFDWLVSEARKRMDRAQ